MPRIIVRNEASNAGETHIALIEKVEPIFQKQISGGFIFVNMNDENTKTMGSGQHGVGVVNVDLSLDQAATDHADSCTLIGNLYCQNLTDRSGDTILLQSLAGGSDAIDDHANDGMVRTVDNGEGMNKDVFSGEMAQDFTQLAHTIIEEQAQLSDVGICVILFSLQHA